MSKHRGSGNSFCHSDLRYGHGERSQSNNGERNVMFEDTSPYRRPDHAISSRHNSLSLVRSRKSNKARKKERERERERQWARTKAFFSKVYPGASKRSGDSLIAWLLCARPGSLLRKRACAYADAHVLETRTQGSVEHLTTGCQSVSQAHPLSQRRKYCNCTRTEFPPWHRPPGHYAIRFPRGS